MFLKILLLEKKIAESSFLQQQTLLSFFAKNYARIMADGYKDFKKPAPAKALSRQRRIAKAIADGDYAAADADIAETLRTRPNDAAALNLRAMMESAQGKYRDAEHTLDQAIQSNPKSYHAYYNMARLILKAYPDNKDGARRYYETGRAMGGPRNAALEEAVK